MKQAREKKGRHSKINRNTLFFRGNSFSCLNIKTQYKKPPKRQEGFKAKWGGPNFYISILCFPLMIVFSPYVLSFSWLYVSFSSHFHLCFLCFLLFSSMMSTSYVFTYRVRWHCAYFPSLVSSISYFLLLFFLSLFLLFLISSPFVYVLFQHDNRAGLSEFHQNGILWENIALCCRVQRNLGEMLFFKVSETQF